MCEETSGSAYVACACPATTAELLWMWTGSLLCVYVCSLSLHCSILFSFLFSPMFSFCLLSFPFAHVFSFLKLLSFFLFMFSCFLHFLHLSLIYLLVLFPAIILDFVYFPLPFFLPVVDPLPSSPNSKLV